MSEKALARPESRSLPDSKPRPLKPIAIADVIVDDEFWSPKLRVWRDITIPDAFAKFDRDGAFTNFDRVAAGESGGHAGRPWYDGLIYEMIRGASDFLAASPDPDLDERLDGYIERIVAAAAVDPDGYLNTYPQLMHPTHRWGLHGGYLRLQHDVYNAGALVEAGVHHYLATGKVRLLTVATRFANHLSEVMGPPPRRNIVPAHSGPEEALVKLYRLFREQPELKLNLPLPIDEQRYLELAEFWIESRGNHVGQPRWGVESDAKCEEYVRSQAYGDGRPSWGSYAQDHQPVLEQETIEGHAVRAALLCTGLIAAAAANGRADYYRAARRLWDNLVTRRMYVTGGVGAFARDERFGPDYALPNDGYLETCGAVGAGFFHHNMSLAFADARYADELERVLYNGALSGVSLRGDTYFYQNPLEADLSRARWSWHGCPCCPPMFLKMMGALPGYIYAHDDDGIYVNLFIGSLAHARLGQTILEIRQTTRYPWDGGVEVSINPKEGAEFEVNLRVPGWCRGPTFQLNGRAIEPDSLRRGYAIFRRRWQRGEVLRVDFPMPVQPILANPLVDADANRLALTRGPLVYCLESVDNVARVRGLSLAPTARFEVEHRPDLLGGVSVIRAGGSAPRTWGDQLYQPAQEAPGVDAVELIAVPYYANANRGPAELATWLRMPMGAYR